MTNKYKHEKSLLAGLATKQQMNAADPSSSVWVEASAGTGKTKVLSDRVLRLLLSKVDASKILCLTYTKAAAVEMNDRIVKKLSSWAVENEDTLRYELSKLLGIDLKSSQLNDISKYARTLFASLLDTPGGVKIQTIHSFCQDVLKRFPLEAGVSPYYEVLDDRSAKEILQNIKLDLFNNASNNNESFNKAISYLINNISEFKFPEILNMITENRSKIDFLLKKYDSIDEISHILEKELDISILLNVDDLKSDFIKNINKDLLKQSFEALKRGCKEDINKSNIIASLFENNFDVAHYDSYKSIFLTKDGDIRKNLARKDAIKIFPEILSFMENEAERLLDRENKIKSLNVICSTISILHVAKNIIDAYNNYKEIYSVLDYEDLIIKTRNLLEHKEATDWVLFKLDGGIEHILIDEAQDTSPNQWAIIKALTQEFFAGIGANQSYLKKTVFVVGDRKQSIYSFQGADPREFDKMYRYFDEKSNDFQKIHLDVSFRSTKAIMDCVNILFSNIDAKKGVVPDNEEINHRPFRLGEGGRVEIFPLLTVDKDEVNNDYSWHIPLERIQKNSPSNMLAKHIAQNIKSMVENKEILASKNRPIRYGDFMFLVQQRNSFVEEFVRACKEIGVNVAGVDKLKLLEQIAIQDLISISKFLLLPDDDLSLAEGLKSPIFGLTDDDLLELCYKRKGSLFNNILKNSKYENLATQLKTLINLVGFARPYEIYTYILVKLNGRKNFISRMGNEVEDVLDEFLNLAISFEQKQIPTLENFINWVIKDEVIVQKQMEQGDSDTVKIMTVHGSKGLQAPIVILADTTKVKNKACKAEFLWHDNIFYFPLSSKQYNDKCKAIKEKQIEDDYDEYRRLLYVALTRAEDRLYIAGYTKDKEANEKSWYSLLKNNLFSNIELDANDKRIVYNIEQENEIENALSIEHINQVQKDYSDILSSAPIENPLAKPYSPSKLKDDETEVFSSPLDDNGDFYKRGTAIHKILQFIGSIESQNRKDAILTFLDKELVDFSKKEHLLICDEVLNLCDKYSEIFSTNSFSEIPIIGEVDGKIFSSKVDKLVVLDDKIMIVDYKTNRPAANTIDEVPTLYINQLNIYKKLLQKLYPEKVVETFLLWTNTCNMMKV